VVEPDDLGIAFREAFEHPLDFLGRRDGLGLPQVVVADDRAVGARMAEFGLAMPLDRLLDADAPGDDREVRRQRAGPLESPEDAVIVIDDTQEDIGGNIFDVGVREREAPGMRHVMDDVVD
jgi:hypothetical protein